MVIQDQNLRRNKPCNKKKKYPADLSESRFIIMPKSDPLFSLTMFARLATGAAKRFVCSPLI